MRTTININSDLKEKLISTAQVLEITTHDLIALLINYSITRHDLKVTTFKSISYQERDPEKRWNKFHVKFEPQMYEKSLDAKKCYKLSISLIISLAIENVLDKVINEVKNSQNRDQVMDNYPPNYTFIVKELNGVQEIITYWWGIPEERRLERVIT